MYSSWPNLHGCAIFTNVKLKVYRGKYLRNIQRKKVRCSCTSDSHLRTVHLSLKAIFKTHLCGFATFLYKSKHYRDSANSPQAGMSLHVELPSVSWIFFSNSYFIHFRYICIIEFRVVNCWGLWCLFGSFMLFWCPPSFAIRTAREELELNKCAQSN